MPTNLREWGFIKDKETEDKKLKDELKQIAEDIQDLFDKLGLEDLGKGPKKADFDVRWQDIAYPVKDSEQVTSGDTISFSVRIKSSYATDKKFEYKLYVLNPATGEVVSSIGSDKITIKSNTAEKLAFIHKITNDNSVRFAENRIVLSVKVIGSGKEKKKELPYFFDIERPDNRKESVKLSLHECLFPIEGSRRVNFGEKVRQVCYKIENQRNHELSYKLNVSIHNASDPTCPKIVDVASFTGEVKPFEDVITPYIEEIVFEKVVYEQYLTEGVLELRARLIANKDDNQYEKGDKITFYHYKVFLNSDEKNGKNDAFDIQSIVAPENYKRSWCTPGNGRTIFLNVGHAAYLNVQDYPDIQHEYLREQMLKQYVLLYLGEGKYDMFGQDEWFSDDLKKLDDDRVYLKLQGHWIIEMSEMLATSSAKSIEEIRSFISRQKETYRTPYEAQPKDRLRQCVFGGSFNTLDFLPLDRAGNRRFLPIMIYPENAEVHILEDEDASRDYLLQVWAEAMTIYRSGHYSMKFSKSIQRQLVEVQKDFMPEDTEAGQIQGFLEHYTGSMVCSKQLFKEALGHTYDEPKRWQLHNINEIMNTVVTGWKHFSNPRMFAGYGRQRGWERDVSGNELPSNEDGFVELTEEECRQLELLKEWIA